MFGGKETPEGARFWEELKKMESLQVNIGYNESSGLYKTRKAKKGGRHVKRESSKRSGNRN